jgi:hypothetical protein
MVRLARIDPAKENAVPSAGGVHAVEEWTTKNPKTRNDLKARNKGGKR